MRKDPCEFHVAVDQVGIQNKHRYRQRKRQHVQKMICECDCMSIIPSLRHTISFSLVFTFTTSCISISIKKSHLMSMGNYFFCIFSDQHCNKIVKIWILQRGSFWPMLLNNSSLIKHRLVNMIFSMDCLRCFDSNVTPMSDTKC